MELTLNFYSNALFRNVNVNIYIPDGKNLSELNTVIFLHGYNEIPQNPFEEDFCYEHKLAVVFPDGEKSFWLDGISNGQKYSTFVGKELIVFLQNMSLARPSNTCIIGRTTGGFSALQVAFTYPENFSHVCAYQPALFRVNAQDTLEDISLKLKNITSQTVPSEILNEFFEPSVRNRFDLSIIFKNMINKKYEHCPDIYFIYKKNNKTCIWFNDSFRDSFEEIGHKEKLNSSDIAYDKSNDTDDFKNCINDIFPSNLPATLPIEKESYENYLMYLIKQHRSKKITPNQKNRIKNRPTIKDIYLISALLKLDEGEIDTLMSKAYPKVTSDIEIVKKIVKQYRDDNNDSKIIIEKIEERIGPIRDNRGGNRYATQ